MAAERADGRAATWAVVVLGAAFGLTAVVRDGVILAVSDLDGWQFLDALFVGTLAAHLVAFWVWVRGAKRLVEEHGGDDRTLRSGLLTAWRIAFFASIFPILFADFSNPGGLLTTVLALQMALRVAATAFLIAGVLSTRGRIDRFLAGPRPAVAWTPPAQAATPYVGTPVPGLPLPATPQPGDWDAGVWDPAIQAEVDRKRRAAGH